MHKKKILYMLGWFTAGGIENYVLNVLDHIDKERYEIDFVLHRNGTYGAEKILLDRGHSVYYYSADNFKDTKKEILPLLEQGKYDIIHIMQGYLAPEPPTIFSIACISHRSRLGFKVINHSHGTEDLTRTRPLPIRLARALYRSVLRLRLKQADAFVACSPEAGSFLYGKNTDVHVLFNGINLERFTSAAKSVNINFWRKKYRIPEERVNFVVVARIADEKNPLFLINVLEHLKEFFPHILLTWVGDGPMQKEMERLISLKNLSEYVNLLGIQHHPEEILACCDYFILPSKREGAPLTLIEAQAANLRCFASDRVPKITDCGGITYIALDKTPKQWAEEIYQIITNNPHPRIDQKRLNCFDAQKTVRTLCNLYDKLTC